MHERLAADESDAHGPSSRIFRTHFFKSSMLGCGAGYCRNSVHKRNQVALVRHVKTALQRFAVTETLS